MTANQRILSNCKIVSKLLAYASLLIAVLVVIGYFLNIKTLQSIIPTLPSMNPMTATMIMLISSSILFKESNKRKLSPILSWLVLLITFTRFLDLINNNIDINSRIIKLIFRSDLITSPVAYLTAFSFALLAISMLIDDYKISKVIISQILVSISLFIGSFAIIGYTLGAKIAGTFLFFAAMALHTSITIILLSISIILIDPDKGTTKIIVSAGVGGNTSRRLINYIIIGTLCMVLIIDKGIKNNLYEPSVGSALFSVTFAAFFIIVTLITSVKTENLTELLQECKAWDDVVLSSIGDAMVIINYDGTIKSINATALSMLNYEESEILGKAYEGLWKVHTLSGSVLNDNELPLNRVLNQGIKESGNFYYVFSDTEKVAVSSTMTPIILEGRILGAINIFRDITRENEIDRAKSEFVSIASHQLRTPLSSINWNAELLISGDAGEMNETQQMMTNEIYDASRRMVDLVRSLLNVSRIELGSLHFEPSMNDFNNSIDKNIKELIPLSKVHKNTIIRNYADIPEILFDDGFISILAQNLISNAIKYTPPDGTITIETSLLDKESKNKSINNLDINEPTLLFAVSDSGIGIPIEQQDKMYTKMFRASNAQIMSSNGNGLGLYIAKGIVESIGGKIWFISDEGKGTNFYVLLPLKGLGQNLEGSTLLDA